ncbi:DUF4169 family protein [Methylosinus sp. Sm6]|uniref:DUF4169 family protein n=1 Tax=Methylosinus sp. Sm6 TaxID=2866948 RepID=UPI001C99D53D|nr:DUF4169 family protein [Methylosinus sp. Sm6]MBY6240885.1 DUF4169 family protein [Methylosinus sp. Sm6]
MGEIVNLRRARKDEARRRREAEASSNRLAFGRSKTERELAAASAELEKKRLDAHRLTDGEEDEARR